MLFSCNMFITAVLLWSRNLPPYTAAVLISAASPETLKSGQLRLNSVDISSQDLNMVTRWRPTGTSSESEYEGLKKNCKHPAEWLAAVAAGFSLLFVRREPRSRETRQVCSKTNSLEVSQETAKSSWTIKSSFTRIQTVASVFHPLPVCSEKTQSFSWFSEWKKSMSFNWGRWSFSWHLILDQSNKPPESTPHYRHLSPSPIEGMHMHFDKTWNFKQ